MTISNEEIVERIKSIAKAKNTTIAEIERAVKFGNGTIGKWRKQPKCPTFDKLLAVANYLEVSVPYLCGTTDDPTMFGKEKAPTQTGERSLEEEVAMVTEAYLNADKEQRAAILTLLTRK